MKKRVTFSTIKEVVDIPHLLAIQRDSYAEFLQRDVPRTRRKDQGLQEVFQEMFPLEVPAKKAKLEFVTYFLGVPKYNVDECRKRAMSYASPLKLRLRLRTENETREQDVYICDLPLMTDEGTFLINGDERVVVSQLHRSAGVSFEETLHPSGKKLCLARIIPYRGSWLEFEFDIYDTIHVVVDKRRKFLASTFLRAIGLSSDEDILKTFCGVEKIEISRQQQFKELKDSVLAAKIMNKENGQVLAEAKTVLTNPLIDRLWDAGVRTIKVLKNPSEELLKTLERDPTHSKEEALLDIYRKLRPTDPATIESAEGLMHRLFFDPKRYDFSASGRYLLNRKLDMKAGLEDRVLTTETVIRVMQELVKVKNGERPVEDIDHLGNRRVRRVGELLQNQIRIGFARMDRVIRERMNLYDLDKVMPSTLINAKMIATAVKDFFGRSQLSQFMDQTNPLAELTHKRRMSALGPGGLNRKRAGFEVRDVHYSHYGRMCPIETPEGPNIGLINSLACYARVNEYGFVETPYRKVTEGKVTNRIEYLSADIEDNFIIAQANAPLKDEGSFATDRVFCRYKSDFILSEPQDVQFMDVSPKQLISIAAGLIPFLEHNDANRALMGSNMQRQAVPLLFNERPLVGTGLEYRAVTDSGAVVVARNSGKVNAVQSDEIVVGGTTYKLRKFERSNANTSVNQRPLVKLGDMVEEGQVIADGPATDQGELSLGRNVLVAFMPWRGYNFEDAIVVSERLLKGDVYTSVHIEEFELESRETRLGNEEITRDIPNVGDEALKNLDERGIVRIGAEVNPGDILVGKVSPKTETELSPEEKLLRAIFGEKAGDVRDSSLTVPPGVTGVIVDVRCFSRKEARTRSKAERTQELKEISALRKQYQEQIAKLKEERREKLEEALYGKKLAASLLDDETGKTLVPQDRTVTREAMKRLERCDIESLKLKDDPQLERDLKRIIRMLDSQIEELTYEEEREIERVKRGDELPPGVLKKIVVYVATKRKLSVGDKMAGRHGNKGVIAKIVPEEDMPYMEDGTPVDIVLNPLGVPSRMNIGQILETHLGWAGKVLGLHFSSPVFDGVKEEQIRDYMRKANIPEEGKVRLFDGFTGEPFNQKVTIGYIYIMKLIHLVDEKIHARAIGPYSLVTQQPLGGKAQFGGQRFGEMEVWALEAYGAAYTLQELLTVKSDDVIGRTKIYESIVKGENALHVGTPESFNVLVKELQSLCLDVRLNKTGEVDPATLLPGIKAAFRDAGKKETVKN